MSASRRRRGSRSRQIGTIAGALAFVLAAGGATYGGVRLAASPQFALGRVDVRGAVRTDPREVRAAVGVPAGSDVWLVDVWAVERRVERLPWVARATVVRGWPNRFGIAVAERRPVARIALKRGGGEFAVIDDGGRVLSAGALDPRDAALVELSVTPEPAEAAVPGAALGEDVGAGLRAVQRLRRLGLRVASIEIRPATGVAATTDNHLRVVFGSLDDLDKKVRTFLAIAARINRPAEVAYVDVRSVRAPTVMYK